MNMLLSCGSNKVLLPWWQFTHCDDRDTGVRVNWKKDTQYTIIIIKTQF